MIGRAPEDISPSRATLRGTWDENITEENRKKVQKVGMFDRYLELFWGKPAVELLSAGKEGLGGSPGDI